MRLLTIATDPNAGGSAISLLNLLIGLKNSGIEIMVIIPRKGFLSDHLYLNKIKYTTIPYLRYSIWPPTKSFKDKMLFVPRFICWRLLEYLSRKKIIELATKFKPDIIHSNVSLFSAGYFAAKALGIPHLWHIREYGNLDFDLSFFPSKRRQIELLKETQSIAITSGLKEYFGLGDKCHVIYNGIKSQNDVIYNPHKKDFYLFVGHVNPNKGVTDLIKAFIEYRQEGGKLKLVIVGRYEKSYKSQLISLLQKEQLTNFVLFMGQIDNVDTFMQNAKALIIPSKYEGFGRITAEAMFNGCLTIGRNTGGTKEQYELGHKITGEDIGFPFLTISGLKDVMLKVDNIPNDINEKMIFKSQKFATKFFSIENNIKSTIEYLTEIKSNSNKSKI